MNGAIAKNAGFNRKTSDPTETLKMASAAPDAEYAPTETPKKTVVINRMSATTLFYRILNALGRAIRRLFVFGVLVVALGAMYPAFKDEVPVLYQFGYMIIKAFDGILRIVVEFFARIF